LIQCNEGFKIGGSKKQYFIFILENYIFCCFFSL
jgi:hypothetical protein